MEKPFTVYTLVIFLDKYYCTPLYPDMFLGFFRVVLEFVKSTLPENLHWCHIVWIFAPARPRSWHTQTPGACGTHAVGCFFWPRERCFHPKKKGLFECQRLIFDQKKQQKSTEYVGKTEIISTCWTTKIHQKFSARGSHLMQLGGLGFWR